MQPLRAVGHPLRCVRHKRLVVAAHRVELCSSPAPDAHHEVVLPLPAPCARTTNERCEPARLPGTRSKAGWDALRLTLAVLIAVHGWTQFPRWRRCAIRRLAGQPGVAFRLGHRGLRDRHRGHRHAASGRASASVFPLTRSSLRRSDIAGIVLVHAPEGWFVVGKGRNGVEFSVLLVVALLCVGLQHAPRNAAH